MAHLGGAVMTENTPDAVKVLERLIATARLLYANAEGCAVNHHGADFELHGMPGWLTDCAADIAAAQSLGARAMQDAMAGRVRVRPSPQIGEEADKYCAERGERWAKTFRALRNYRMGNMVDEDGGSYPLVDLLTRPGDSINDGEFELISIVDEVFSALEPAGAQEGAEVTYSSTQATKCCQCGEMKHTPLRVDHLGGYICLTCIDRELHKAKPSPAPAPDATGLVALGPRPCDCERCDCGNVGDAQAVAAWDERAALRSQADTIEARATAAEAERDAWRERESETQEALQKIGQEFGFIGGEPRVDAVRRVLTEMRAERDALRNRIAQERQS
jgi:hypothetical protein